MTTQIKIRNSRELTEHMRNTAWFLTGVVGMTMLIIVGLSGGCTGTVAPKPIAVATTAWSGNQQNAGVLAFQPDGALLINADARVRYNALIAMQPEFKKLNLVLPLPAPIPVDFGVTALTNGNFEMTDQAFHDFATLNRWFHQAQTK